MNKRNHFNIIALVLVTVMVFVTAAISFAQTETSTPPKKETKEPVPPASATDGASGPRIEKFLEKMTTRLELTAEQQSKIRVILVKQRELAKQERQAGETRRDDKNIARERMEAANKDIEAILTEKQVDKYKEWKKQVWKFMSDRFEEHQKGMREERKGDKEESKDMNGEEKEHGKGHGKGHDK